MKILVLNFQGAKPDVLFADTRLQNLRRLMDLGCFGELMGEASDWHTLARSGDHTLTLAEFFQQADRRAGSFQDWGSLHSRLDTPDWDYCELVDARLRNASHSPGAGSTDEYVRLDQELGDVLQTLEDDTIIAVLGDGCFLLISGNNPISGQYTGGFVSDIPPTLLELAGYSLPPAVEGRSWVAGMELKRASGLTEDEEAMLRERLSGLGYI